MRSPRLFGTAQKTTVHRRREQARGAHGGLSAWIFGYGSLVWRPDFPYLECRTAAIDGWSRRFWQGSTDHRGVPGDPGRVVTLVREPGARCWGRAYRIGGRDGEAILEGLAFREKGGYDRIVLDLHFAGAPEAPAPGFVYFANPDNPNWLGPAPLADIARQVRRSRGPSGANVEYVMELAGALRAMEVEDAHVFALADLVKGQGAP